MVNRIEKVVVVGGGSAGWLTAATLAAEFKSGPGGISVTLIESAETKSIGVGEGTWPSMRTTLQKIGISETEFFRECDASFKQGSKFTSWLDGGNESYYHPFSLPEGYQEINLADFWAPHRDKVSFANAVCPQLRVCEGHKAPKQISAPDYAGSLNYGYHLDAIKFARLLRKHAVEKLGVTHVIDHVEKIHSAPNGDIASLQGKAHGQINGDLFIDCTGFASLLIGRHYSIPLIGKKDVLFNDRAIAVQVPYADESAPIASATLSTARSAGWIWDIGLPSRRGTGYVFSSKYIDEQQAVDELKAYVGNSAGIPFEELAPRTIDINPGYRQKFWHKNCVAIGLSAGFVEPLEASALVLIELSARMIAEQMPADRQVMDIVAEKFNDKFATRWQQIIGFLKLHYVLSRRNDSQYWLDNRSAESIPSDLAAQLKLWRTRSPWYCDETHVDQMFPSASYQYVLYGMEYPSQPMTARKRSGESDQQRARQIFASNDSMAGKLLTNLPTNRDLTDQVKHQGFGHI